MDLRFFEIYRSGEYMSLILGLGSHFARLDHCSGHRGFHGRGTPEVQEGSGTRPDCRRYIDFINTPLIVQLFFIAFGLPMLFGYVWPFWCHALLALTINFSFREILRSGFASTQKGQLEAAAALKQDSIRVDHCSSNTHKNVSVTLQSVHLFIFNHRGDFRWCRGAMLACISTAGHSGPLRSS